MRLSPRIVCKEQTHCVHRFRKACCFVYVFAVIAVGLPGAAHGATPLRPDPESLERATPALIKQLRADPYDYFRFVNRSWIGRV